MKIENLQVNQIVKNYKELCNLLEEKVSSGKSKTLQLKNFERYFTYHKEGNKFIINEIYDIPKPKIDNRGKSEGSRNNNNIYSKYIEKLVLDLLVQQYDNTDNIKNKKIYMSRDRMLMALNMVNDNYTYGKFNKKQLSYYINVDADNTKEFYNINNKNLLDTVERAFDSLANKCLIDWNLVTTVALNEEYTYINSDGQEVILTELHKTADEYERVEILKAEQKILINMGMESKKEVYLKDMYKEFNKKVCDLLKEETDIKYYYKSYDIVFHENIVKELEKINKFILEQQERQNIKITLNGIISDNFKKNAIKRQDKAIEEKEKIFGINDNRFAEIKRERRSDEEYAIDNNKIIDTVINYKTRDLTLEMQTAYNNNERKEQEEINEILDTFFTKEEIKAMKEDKDEDWN